MIPTRIQKLSRRQQFIWRNDLDELVQLFARAKKQHCRDRSGNGHPRRLCESNRSEEVGHQVGNGNHQGCCPASRRRTQMGVMPDRGCYEAGDEGERVSRLDQVEHRAGEREHRKCSYSARDGPFVALVSFFKS